MRVMQAVDVILHGVWYAYEQLRNFYPLMISSWWGLVFLGFTAFNLSWVVFWWTYYRADAVWHWLVRAWVATVNFLSRLPEFWFRFCDLARELYHWLCAVVPDFAGWCYRWVYHLLRQEYIWARDGNIVGLAQSFAITAGFGFITYCCYTVWYGRGPLRALWDLLRASTPESVAEETRGEPNSPRERHRRLAHTDG